MRPSKRIVRVMGLVLAVILLTLAPKGAQTQEIRLFGLGNALEKPSVRRALMHAINWESHAGNIYDDPYLPVVFFVEGQEPIYNYDLDFDPVAASALINEAVKEGLTLGEDGLELTLMYEYEPTSAELADAISDDLLEYLVKTEQPIAITIFEASTFDQVVEYVEGKSEDQDHAKPGENILILLGLTY